MLFKLVDHEGRGSLSEEQFRSLLSDKMQVVESAAEVDYLLKAIDPYNNQRMTYSEVVQLLSS